MRSWAWWTLLALVACDGVDDPVDDTDTDTNADTDTDEPLICDDDAGADVTGAWSGLCTYTLYGYYAPEPQVWELRTELDLTDASGTVTGTVRSYDEDDDLAYEADVRGCRVGADLHLEWVRGDVYDTEQVLEATVDGDALTGDLSDGYGNVAPCELSR